MNVSFVLWRADADTIPVTCVGSHGRINTRNQVSIALFSVEASILLISSCPSLDAQYMHRVIVNMKVDEIRVEK